jgi:excisionase family DNA binding protein
MPLFFTPAEAAEILRYSRPTISLKIKSGEIPAVRPSGKVRGRVLIPASYFERLAAAALEGAEKREGNK